MNSKRTVLFLLIVLTVSLVFSGCDAINGAVDSVFLSTTEVKAKDLADYSGTTPSTEDAVMDGFVEGMFLAMDPATDLMDRSLGSDYEEVVRVLDLTIPGYAESRSAEPVSKAASFGVDFSITDEEVESDYEEGDSLDPGDLTVEEASVQIDLAVDSLDPEKMTEAEADFQTKLEIILKDVVEYGYNYETLDYDVKQSEINQLNLNVNAKGNLKSTFDDKGDPEEVSFYAAADVSIGFSLTSYDENISGKYIVNFNYIQSGTVTADDIETGEYTGDAEDVTLTIKVYNNDNTLVKEYEYDQTELTEMMNQS